MLVFFIERESEDEPIRRVVIPDEYLRALEHLVQREAGGVVVDAYSERDIYPGEAKKLLSAFRAGLTSRSRELQREITGAARPLADWQAGWLEKKQEGDGLYLLLRELADLFEDGVRRERQLAYQGD